MTGTAISNHELAVPKEPIVLRSARCVATLHLGDCQDLLPVLEQAEIDVIVTDHLREGHLFPCLRINHHRRHSKKSITMQSALLVAEYDRSKEDANRMVNEHTSIVVNGIMANMNYRATAMALEMAEDRKRKPVEA